MVLKPNLNDIKMLISISPQICKSFIRYLLLDKCPDVVDDRTF